jgi:hypothetical protein
MGLEAMGDSRFKTGTRPGRIGAIASRLPDSYFQTMRNSTEFCRVTVGAAGSVGAGAEGGGGGGRGEEVMVDG